MKKKLKQYDIYKINTTRFIDEKEKNIKSKPLTLTEREAIENGEIVKIQQNQLTNKILDIFKQKNIADFKLDFKELLVAIVVPTEKKKTGEKEYKYLAENGIDLNRHHYVRLCAGAGQIRRNTIIFVRDDLYAPLFDAMLCGLSIEDFGNDFNSAKFNAYIGLNMSGCHLLPPKLAPRVCIIDDYEQIRPHNIVNHVTESEVNYITLPECDYILKENQTEFNIIGDKAIKKSDGVEFTIRRGIHKHINSVRYNQIEDSPALNSFDGQGLMSSQWAERVAEYLGISYLPSEMIIRAPWVKGMLVNIPFNEWFKEKGITEVEDSFGIMHNVDDIDCFISKSQFKMYKVYMKKCEHLNISAWEFHEKSMKENNLLWGITRVNPKKDDETKALNYQYIQALELVNDDIEKLCEPTKNFLSKINGGNIEDIYSSLIINNKSYVDDMQDIESDKDYIKLFQRVIEANPAFVNDKYIRRLILRECESKLNGAKIGKILINGNFQFCVSDPIAQLEWIAKNHCEANIEVKGVVNAGQIYSDFWFGDDEIVLMRSPMIDKNEIAKRKLMSEKEKYFVNLKSGIIFSIHDLTALGAGGMDYDGDIIFSTTNEIVKRGCFDYKDAKPLYYDLKATDIVGRIDKNNLIEADIRGLNSKIGTISNKATSFYAMLQNYSVDDKKYKNIYDSIISLGMVVGMEIDRIKTGIAPTIPLEWKSIQPKRMQSVTSEKIVTISDDEQQGVYRHNDLVPTTKPYFFRYLYDYIDAALIKLNKCFNEVSVLTFGLKMNELIDACITGNATEEMKNLYKYYLKNYPVLDTDCIVNHICHLFENFEKKLNNNSVAEGVNMLKNFVDNSLVEKEIVEEIKPIIKTYKRFNSFLQKKINTNSTMSNKEKDMTNKTSQIFIRNHSKNLILNLCDGDLNKAFSNAHVAAKDEEIIWKIFDKDLVKVIKVEDK